MDLDLGLIGKVWIWFGFDRLGLDLDLDLDLTSNGLNTLCLLRFYVTASNPLLTKVFFIQFKFE